WFAGHWGFQFYAEHVGMVPVSPTESRLDQGDWLVYPWSVHKQALELDDVPSKVEAKIPVDDPVKLRTVMCYYSGDTAVENRDRPRVEVWVLRVTGSCVPGYIK